MNTHSKRSRTPNPAAHDGLAASHGGPFTHVMPVGNQAGFVVNPVAATLFCGLVMVVVVYSALDQTGAMARLGRFGPVLPLFVIVWLMYGIYRGFRFLKNRASRLRVKGPLFMRSLMNDCLERTCGPLQKRLRTPEIDSTAIFNAILLDKVHAICAADCMRFSDIRRKIEGSRLKGTQDLVLADFFQADVTYKKRPLPDEIQQVADMVSRGRSELKGSLEALKKAHAILCTGMGSILDLLPPDPGKVEKLRSTYKYRPPTPERAQRMMFALDTLAYLRAIRHENVNPMDRRRHDAVAGEAIPKLADALAAYKAAWQDLVDTYESPRS